MPSMMRSTISSRRSIAASPPPAQSSRWEQAARCAQGLRHLGGATAHDHNLRGQDSPGCWRHCVLGTSRGCRVVRRSSPRWCHGLGRRRGGGQGARPHRVLGLLGCALRGRDALAPLARLACTTSLLRTARAWCPPWSAWRLWAARCSQEERPGHSDPSHCLGASKAPPPKPANSPPP